MFNHKNKKTMKKMISTLALLMIAIGMFAKDVKTVVLTTLPQMSCENCENKIKGNLRFEKGIKDIQTNVAEQKVTITYDADKTNPDNLIKAMKKIGYQATIVDEAAPQKKCNKCPKQAEKHEECAKKQGTCEKKQGGCEKKEGGCCKKQGSCCKQQGEQKAADCCKKKAEGNSHCDKKQDGDCK